MKTIALKENNPITAAFEPSTLERLKSFHFGRAVGIFKEGVAKLSAFDFRLSYYQFIWGMRLHHVFTRANIYQENTPVSHLLSSIQQIELGYLCLFFAALVWIFTSKCSD